VSSTSALPSSRPAEREALLNPPFISLVIAHAAAEHQRRTDRAMPYALCFLVAPIALHEATREALPRKVTAKLGPRLEAHALLRAGFAGRARTLAPWVRAGLRDGVRSDILTITDAAIEGRPPRPHTSVTLSNEVLDIFKRAAFAGGWLGLAGSPAASYAMWRVRP
jgi:Family of unknown function (DUF6521)